MTENTKNQQTTKEFNWKSKRTIFFLIIAAIILFPFAIRGIQKTIGLVGNYYKTILIPNGGDIIHRRILPDRKNRPDRNRRDQEQDDKEDNEGWLDWNFIRCEDTTGFDNSTCRWIRQNIPDATQEEIINVAYVFYDAADAIHDGKTNTPVRSIAFLKKGLLQAVGTTWDDFFNNLTHQIIKEDVNEIEDVADIYEIIGNAIYDTSQKTIYESTQTAKQCEQNQESGDKTEDLKKEEKNKKTTSVSPQSTQGQCANGQCYINGRGGV